MTTLLPKGLLTPEELLAFTSRLDKTSDFYSNQLGQYAHDNPPDNLLNAAMRWQYALTDFLYRVEAVRILYNRGTAWGDSTPTTEAWDFQLEVIERKREQFGYLDDLTSPAPENN